MGKVEKAPDCQIYSSSPLEAGFVCTEQMRAAVAQAKGSVEWDLPIPVAFPQPWRCQKPPHKRGWSCLLSRVPFECHRLGCEEWPHFGFCDFSNSVNLMITALK